MDTFEPSPNPDSVLNDGDIKTHCSVLTFSELYKQHGGEKASVSKKDGKMESHLCL